MTSFIKDITTISNGEDYCVVRIMMVISFVTVTLCMVGGFMFEVIAFYHLAFSTTPVTVVPPHFDATGYCGAVTATMVGGAAGIQIKKKDEPI